MKNLALTLFIILSVFVSSCTSHKEFAQIQSEGHLLPDKKVIVIIIDSLVDKPLKELINNGSLPGFAFLEEKGWYTNKFISTFPTMSVVIESSMLTGSHPNRHHIPGLRWYDMSSGQLVNYGDGFTSSLRSGVKRVLDNGLYHLNNTHLNKEVLTMHEALYQHQLSSASLNALVYRGSQNRKLKTPLGPNTVTMAPDYFVLGNFHHELPHLGEQYFKSYGVNDEVSTKHLIHLIQQGTLPSLTIMYMPNLDSEAHKEGNNSEKTLKEIDRKLQDILNALGNWEEALQDHIFIVMGDSGFTQTMEKNQESVIDLAEVFNRFNIADPIETLSTDHIAVAVNGRMAYVYPLQQNIDIKSLVDIAKNNPHFDTITRVEGEWIEVIEGGTTKRLRFRPGKTFKDEFSQEWDVEGDWSVLNMINDGKSKRILFNDYPDGLMQLYAAAHSHKGPYLILTTEPGYEMTGAHSPTHPGGANHGSFHKKDVEIPFFIAGTEKRPKTLRIVDLKPFIFNLIFNSY
ncbi:alkaline phosphatase family protein [Ammoniphilus sp. CFH 90114]|uniref:alkaline phosphatase family protein n=1 Tax=Ammoniphilus sp. CFH 90114 TaxID=2493665 RepID=UPI00100F85A4|nr:alkaline phosphatase family protein [Ammoniphilus sp. CFH 90114]RXT06456.1 hypothetical protein EIZ39_15415 [Ammoniphilus sp. CFH 90114]